MRGSPVHPLSDQLMAQVDRAPVRALPAQLQHPGFEHRRHLVGHRLGAVRPLRQGLDAPGLVAGHPPVEALAADPELRRHLADCQAVSDDRHDGVVTLFHSAELPEHSGHLLVLEETRPVAPRCQASAVTASHISRYAVPHQALLECSRSGVMAQWAGGPPGARTGTLRLKSPALPDELAAHPTIYG